MRFTPTGLEGAYVIDIERHDDERGGFARTFCAREFAEHGIDATVVQTSLSWNNQRGTLRGMHYQDAPHREAKTVRVTAGAIFDVLVDVRADSETFARWFGTELSASNARALHIPAGFAHGFLTLTDDSVVQYQMSAFYEPTAARGFRWDDPMVGIAWPYQPVVVSDRDHNLPRLAR